MIGRTERLTFGTILGKIVDSDVHWNGVAAILPRGIHHGMKNHDRTLEATG
jgi:hypothetical protein